MFNGITLCGKPVYDPPGNSLPGVNSYETHTGASRYGFGRFLMLRSDYDTAVASGSPAGTGNLVLSSGSWAGDTKIDDGQGVTIPVTLAGANPISTSRDGSNYDLVEVMVFDRRCKPTSIVGGAYNIVEDATGSGTARFYAGTLNGGSEWTWTTALANLGSLVTTTGITLPSTWNPRNWIVDGRSNLAAIDQIAAKLFAVVGYDATNNTFALYNPGSLASANSTLLTTAAPAIQANHAALRNALRLPGVVRVTFPAQCTDPADPYDKLYNYVDYTNAGGDAAAYESLGVGEYVGVWNGTSWVNAAEMNAVAADVGARYIAQRAAAIGEAEYAGIWPFTLDGKIRGIRWVSDQNGARTFLRFNNEQDWMPSGLMRAPLVITGGGEVAAWDALGGARAVAPGAGGGSGASIKWGRVTADWDSATPNHIVLQPWTQKVGGSATGEDNVTVMIDSPDGATPLRVDIAEDDVVAYMTDAEGTHVLLPALDLPEVFSSPTTSWTCVTSVSVADGYLKYGWATWRIEWDTSTKRYKVVKTATGSTNIIAVSACGGT